MSKIIKAIKQPTHTASILAQRYLDWYSGFSYDFEKNGELSLIRNIQDVSIQTVFDVGANTGQWAKHIEELLPDAETYCFEISASAHEELQKQICSYNVSRCFHLGLSNVNAELEYKDYGLASTLNTILESGDFWDKQLEYEKKITSVERGDDFCTRLGISSIDFLKIDVEGAENLVLEGFIEMLRSGQIRLIQFEYGYANGDQHFLMKDFYQFFEALGYQVGLVRKNGVIFSEFSYLMNNFLSGPNYAAIRKCDVDIKRKIGVLP